VSLLEVEGLYASYGPVQSLHGIDFEVEEGQTVAILGPNGAGKTTTLRAICGMVHTEGTVRFDGESIAGRATEEIVRRGIAHVPEGRGIFPTLTVDDNLRLGAHACRNGHDSGEDMERCFGYFPRLQERRRQAAGNLSGGEQQMLAVARAVMMHPRLLLLDEPSLGLSPILTREVFKVLREIGQEQQTTMLVVEQNATLVLEFADYAHVLEAGKVALSGDADELRDDDAVRRSYLAY
jgi:branched-chain amino acid transport system ATP-binding protein